MAACSNVSWGLSSDESSVDDDFLIIYLSRKRKRPDRRFWVHPLNSLQPSNGIYATTRDLASDPEKFQSFYRMKKETFNKLIEIVGSKIAKKDTNFREAVPVEERLLITLRFLATGSSFRAMSFTFLRGETTIGKIVDETCHIIWEELRNLYMPAPREEDWKAIAQRYNDMWQMPNCVGSLDGKHIRICRPKNTGSAYINYNSFFSIVLLAVADADSTFTVISVGDYGRNSDGGVLKSSTFGKLLASKRLSLPSPIPLPGEAEPFPFYFVADEAFPLQESIMRPYPGRSLNNDKRVFNNRLSRARKSVECAFGRMASKFRVLHNRMSIEPQRVKKVVQAACILHNFIFRNEKSQQQDQDIEAVTLGTDLESYPRRGSSLAAFNRDKLMAHFMKPGNEIPGQNRYSV